MKRIQGQTPKKMGRCNGYSEKAIVNSLGQGITSSQSLCLVQGYVVVCPTLSSSMLRLHHANFESVLEEVRWCTEEVRDKIESPRVGNRGFFAIFNEVDVADPEDG